MLPIYCANPTTRPHTKQIEYAIILVGFLPNLKVSE